MNTYHSSNTIHHYHQSIDTIHYIDNIGPRIRNHCYIWIASMDKQFALLNKINIKCVVT
jgi:hypothetical protein